MLSMIIKICTQKISLITIYNITSVHGYSNSYQKKKKKGNYVGTERLNQFLM